MTAGKLRAAGFFGSRRSEIEAKRGTNHALHSTAYHWHLPGCLGDPERKGSPKSGNRQRTVHQRARISGRRVSGINRTTGPASWKSTSEGLDHITERWKVRESWAYDSPLISAIAHIGHVSQGLDRCTPAARTASSRHFPAAIPGAPMATDECVYR
jgi:hypothetical protein